jgi:ubiquinone/menaquinone biosynthesis C-methylase UbiE
MPMERFDHWAPHYDYGALQPVVYHAMHEAVLRQVVHADVRPLTMLDLGCGTGHLLARAGHRLPAAVLIGVDASGMMLVVARRRGGPIRFVRATAERLPFADAVFERHHLYRDCSPLG